MTAFNQVPVFSPRIWHGMETREVARLLRWNRYKIDAVRWPMAIGIFIASGIPVITNRLQAALFGKRADELPLKQDPIFLIGHWRSGTTLLHELLRLDDRFATPDTFQCFNPNSFLLTQSWLKPMTGFLLPKRRPMDNMDMGWDVAQEDEFALLTMGLPTTYRRIAFPNHPPRHLDYLNMVGIPQPELDRWKAGLRRFIAYLNFHYQKPLVLKSPPHTGRMHLLKQMYPDARFIHLTRHPLQFIPSTIHMWSALDLFNGFQIPHNQELEDYVFRCFDRLYRGFHRGRPQISEDRFVEVRFEDLVANPMTEVRRIYEKLELGGYAAVAAQIGQRWQQHRSYQRNKHELSSQLRETILQRCADYQEHFGYSPELVA